MSTTYESRLTRAERLRPSRAGPFARSFSWLLEEHIHPFIPKITNLGVPGVPRQVVVSV
jgi:hypothetical protein